MKMGSVLVLGLALAGCASNKYTVDGPNPPPVKPVFQPYVPVEVPGDDFMTAAGSNAVLFETNSSYLDAQAREILERQAAWIITHRGVPILVEGHCDERATKKYNLELGRRRARAVVDFFVTKGIPRERFTARSFGEGKPIIDKKGDVQINRRAVTVILDDTATDHAMGDNLPVRDGSN